MPTSSLFRMLVVYPRWTVLHKNFLSLHWAPNASLLSDTDASANTICWLTGWTSPFPDLGKLRRQHPQAQVNTMAVTSINTPWPQHCSTTLTQLWLPIGFRDLDQITLDLLHSPGKPHIHSIVNFHTVLDSVYSPNPCCNNMTCLSLIVQLFCGPTPQIVASRVRP